MGVLERAFCKPGGAWLPQIPLVEMPLIPPNLLYHPDPSKLFKKDVPYSQAVPYSPILQYSSLTFLVI